MNQRQKLQAFLDGMEPKVRAAFLASIDDIRSSAQLSLVVGHLERGDVNAALAALNLRAEFLAPLDDALRAAYVGGGVVALAALPATKVEVRFDGRNPRAEAWLQQYSSERIVEILDDQRNGIRSVLVEGMAKGDNPRTTAARLLGKLNRATGKREGGLIGLTQRQMGAMDNLRGSLTTREGMQEYLRRSRRHRGYDRMVKKALKEGRVLNKGSINKIVAKYSDRLLRHRAETIARTESLSALNVAQREAMNQLIEDDRMDVRNIFKTWRTASDLRVRDSHQNLNREERRYDEPFSNGMMHPGEPDAPPAERINCRCVNEMRVVYGDG